MSFLKSIARSIVFSPAVFPFYNSIKHRKETLALRKKLETKADLLADLPAPQRKEWEERIADVIACPDNADIPRVAQAGNFSGKALIMHNGIKIDPLSYYGTPILKMLMENGGVHEPQEEKVFAEVLASLPQGEKTILELGSYWSFYSMWFLRSFPGSSAYMLEPELRNLYSGKKNFRLNNFEGNFFHLGIGDTENKNERITSPDIFCQKENIQFIDILHADIQTFELAMLNGSKSLLEEKKVGYCFISTHSNELHEQCKSLLKANGFILVADANLDESYSFDGILVMKNPSYPGIAQVNISRKKKL
ncbi:MAG: FkbM family methyltransferase [Bacteroidota bacterium]|nr:FkbM family methyltransferase [Bacteroidota bacterium]